MIDRDLDEQIRNAPNDAHRAEQPPAAASHRTSHRAHGSGAYRRACPKMSERRLRVGAQLRAETGRERIQSSMAITKVTTTEMHATLWHEGELRPGTENRP